MRPPVPLQANTRGASRPTPISRARTHPPPVDVGIQTSELAHPPAEGPAPRDPMRCAVARCCTSQQRNTHSTESREIRYRWHPWFGLTVWVHLTRVSQSQEVVRCGLTPDRDVRAMEIPLWMFEAGACHLMELEHQPVVGIEALRELNALLRHTRFPMAVAVQGLQAGYRDLSSAGGAHAIDSEATATGNSTGAVPPDSQRAELERGPARGSTAGVASAGPHASRARRSPARRRAAAGGLR